MNKPPGVLIACIIMGPLAKMMMISAVLYTTGAGGSFNLMVLNTKVGIN